MQQQRVLDLETKLDQLKAEATERWGDRWFIDVTIWSDDSFQAYAAQSQGQNDDGAVIRERLFMNDDGKVAVDRVTVNRQCVEMETLVEPSDDATS